MPNVVQRISSSDAVLQTIAWIRKQGFKAVPLHYQSKAAVSRAYASPNYQPPTDDLWKERNHGVGVVTGPRNSGPVDIDCDCPEAIYFAARFLPRTTAIFGRASKPRSHYLYKVDTADFDKQAFNDPVRIATKAGDATIVEARGDGGHQTVMPGSIHEATGEPVEWSDVAFPEIATVSTAELLRAVRKVAIATLIVRHVWADGYHNEPCKHLSGLLYYLDWSEDEACDLIQAVMDYTNDDDKSRIPTIRATFRRGEAGKKVSGAGVLRKQLRDDGLVDKLLEWAGSPTVNILQDYNDRFACVLVEGRFRVARVDAGPGKPPLFMVKDDFLNHVATDYTDVEIDGKTKSVPKGKLWLNSPRRRQYDDVDFRPGEEDDGHTLNLWGGWAVQPDESEDYLDKCSGFLDLLFEVICGGDEEMATWLINWMANIVREPMAKSMTAPVIIGPEGAGKSLMTAYFGTILGSSYTVVTQDRHLVGSFNRHLAGTLLLHSEEALYGGDVKHASIIRSLITDEFRMYEQKGIDAKQVRNYLRLILLSNKAKAAPAMPGDRRYTVIDMGKRKASDKLLDTVIREKNSGGPAALFKYLLDFDYSPAMARRNVKNASLMDMKSHNLEPVEAWWMEILMSGTLLPDRLAWAQKPPKATWPDTFGAPALHAAMEMSLKSRGVRHIPHSVSFNSMIERMIGQKIQKQPRNYSNELVGELGVPQSWALLGNSQLSWLRFPSLEVCRKSFDKHIGQTINWPQPDSELREDGNGESLPNF